MDAQFKVPKIPMVIRNSSVLNAHSTSQKQEVTRKNSTKSSVVASLPPKSSANVSLSNSENHDHSRTYHISDLETPSLTKAKSATSKSLLANMLPKEVLPKLCPNCSQILISYLSPIETYIREIINLVDPRDVQNNSASLPSSVARNSQSDFGFENDNQLSNKNMKNIESKKQESFSSQEKWQSNSTHESMETSTEKSSAQANWSDFSQSVAGTNQTHDNVNYQHDSQANEGVPQQYAAHNIENNYFKGHKPKDDWTVKEESSGQQQQQQQSTDSKNYHQLETGTQNQVEPNKSTGTIQPEDNLTMSIATSERTSGGANASNQTYLEENKSVPQNWQFDKDQANRYDASMAPRPEADGNEHQQLEKSSEFVATPEDQEWNSPYAYVTIGKNE